MTRVRLKDLELAYDFVSSLALYECAAYISRQAGEIFWVSEAVADTEPAPDDVDNPALYIAVPHKMDLDLGKSLVFRFVRAELPEFYDEVRDIFRSKGAYSRFKALLERNDQLEQWYRYEESETLAALREWCEQEGIEFIDDGNEPAT